MEKTQKKCDIIFYIHRYDPEKDEGAWKKQYTLQVERGMTVLDGLHKIKETQDPSLAFRFSCRMGVCGSCAMLINGKPMLACNTQILDVTEKILTVAPLPNFTIIRDLVPDLVPMFGVHASVQPHIKRSDVMEMENPTGEYFQTPRQLEEFLQFTYCIKCGACMAACPTMATDRKYPGPMPLTQAYRYNVDSRDDGGKDRKDYELPKKYSFKPGKPAFPVVDGPVVERSEDVVETAMEQYLRAIKAKEERGEPPVGMSKDEYFSGPRTGRAAPALLVPTSSAT